MIRHSQERTSSQQRDPRRRRNLTFERLETRELLSVGPMQIRLPLPAATHTTTAAPPAPVLTPTQLYIKNFNPASYIQKGTEYTNFAYTPAGAAQAVDCRWARSCSPKIVTSPN